MLNRTLLLIGLSGAAILTVAAFYFFAPTPIPVTMPLYPGAQQFEGNRSTHTSDYTFYFASSDPVEEVLAYYDSRLSEDAYYAGEPLLPIELPDIPSCYNLLYRGIDCWTWMRDARDNKNLLKILNTSHGKYVVGINTMPSPSRANETYYLVQVREGEFLRISCGECP